ncbi:MAG: HAD family phosphatase, partial [Rhodoferax sp.]|nr:HAD family phosphatase [Rhodoferax sp.]
MNLVFDFGAVLFTWQPGALMRQHFPQLTGQPEQAAALAHGLFGHADWHDFDRGRMSMAEVSARSA